MASEWNHWVKLTGDIIKPLFHSHTHTHTHRRYRQTVTSHTHTHTHTHTHNHTHRRYCQTSASHTHTHTHTQRRYCQNIASYTHTHTHTHTHFRTLLSILVDLDNAVAWMVTAHPPISKSFGPFSKPLGIVPSAPITFGSTVTPIFHNF